MCLNQFNHCRQRFADVAAFESARLSFSAALRDEHAHMQDAITGVKLKVKELVIIDLSKKHVETGARLREFSKLYDVVKADRNKYVNQIAASAQALAEMKEKIKILQNEVEILRNESLSKDKGLTREASEHVAAQKQRDALRLESRGDAVEDSGDADRLGFGVLGALEQAGGEAKAPPIGR